MGDVLNFFFRNHKIDADIVESYVLEDKWVRIEAISIDRPGCSFIMTGLHGGKNEVGDIVCVKNFGNYRIVSIEKEEVPDRAKEYYKNRSIIYGEEKS